MDTITTLADIRDYLTANRQIGHTTAMVRGAQNVDSVIVLAANHHSGELINKQLPNATVIPITNIRAIRGKQKPMVIDNFALLSLCDDALAEIKRLQKQIADLLPKPTE